MDDSPTTPTPAHPAAAPNDAEAIKQKMKELQNQLETLVSAREDAAGAGFKHDDRAAVVRASQEACDAAADHVAALEALKEELEKSKHYQTAAQAQVPEWQLYVEENLQRLLFVRHGADARLEHTAATAQQTCEAVRELDGLHAVLDILRLGPSRFYALLREHPAFAEELKRRALVEVAVAEKEEPVKEE
ncbi:hypothetical protein PG988_012465 [Apiospora saccharicola]